MATLNYEHACKWLNWFTLSWICHQNHRSQTHRNISQKPVWRATTNFWPDKDTPNDSEVMAHNQWLAQVASCRPSHRSKVYRLDQILSSLYIQDKKRLRVPSIPSNNWGCDNMESGGTICRRWQILQTPRQLWKRWIPLKDFQGSASNRNPLYHQN